jgi:glycosyltransferase involved in cell wall biosynthesis
MSAYNAADTIAYAVRSILGQSHGNLELLICDDGSTDHTPKILAELRKDPRVRLFRSEAQQGTYNIRNNLIREARGTYLTFQDSDDFAFPDRIERQLAFLKREGAAAVAAQWFRITGDGEFVFSSEHAVARLAVVSLFAPRRVFERFGPYRSARFGADTEFYEGLRMRLGTDAVKLMPSPVLFGLSSATSLTRSAGIEASEDGFRAPARRAYAAAAARQRQMGGAHVGLPSPGEVLEAHGVLMADAGVSQLEPGA